MTGEILPAYFSSLSKGEITVYIRKEYEKKLSEQDVDRFFNLYKGPDETDTVYHGRSSCKSLIMNSRKNEKLIVRDYWHGGLFRKILRDYFWQYQRPLRELSICETAIKRGIRTIEIMAIVKKRILGPLYKFKLVSKEIANTVDLMELLLHSDEGRILSQKRQIISKVAQTIKKMHDAGIYHADLHLKNILIQFPGDGGTNVFIIDLDKSKQFEDISLNRRRKNIMRLDRSLDKLTRNNKMVFHGERQSQRHKNQHDIVQSGRPIGLITRTDKIRFLKEYIKTSSGYEKTLKSYLKMYNVKRKLRSFWWSVTGNRSCIANLQKRIVYAGVS